jgi:antitoxin VapB
MTPITARIFRNGRNQAVRIPKELSFSAEAVTIEKHGEALLLRPVQAGGWRAFFSDPTLVLPADFELADDPAPQERPDL